jgi:hypothetical protein
LVHIEILSWFPALKDQVSFYSKSPVLWTFVGKIGLHIRVPAAFLGSRWGKIGSKNWVDLKGFVGQKVRCKSAVFWQTEQYLSVSSTGTENGGYTGISGINRNIGKEKGDHLGLFLTHQLLPQIPGRSDER